MLQLPSFLKIRTLQLKILVLCVCLSYFKTSWGETCLIDRPSTYAQAFEAKSSCHVTNLFARVLRGKTDSDFEGLSDDPQRKIIFLMDSTGLEGLLGKTSTNEILQQIGYTPEYIQTLQQSNTKYKLVVFQHSSKTLLATWENIAALIREAYGNEIGRIVERQINFLKKKSFKEIESEAPTIFSVVNKRGPSDPEYMTEGRLLASQGELWKVRSFLYHRLRLTELFTGDGSTLQSDGKTGNSEYVILNTKVQNLKDVVVIPLKELGVSN